MNWSDERVEILRKLFADGLSAGQIAAELGGVTRNSVIGKVHRMKLTRRYHKPRGTDAALTKSARAPRKKANLKVFDGPTTSFSTAPIIQGDHLAHIEAPIGPRVSILELNEFTCRWPIGDGREVTYCGALPKLKKSYCPYHYGIAHESARSQISREAAEKRWEKRGKRVNTA
jgi:GcrA cell cycle regulator